MSEYMVARLIALGITPDEIWCAIAEPGPWTRTQQEAGNEADELPR